ncbi:MAG TPA: ATP-binding cassette domain-containing protein [Bryobacteraceae bacterium]|nr:ATP-binding cassette domain-containing protein [Bryobacteraceae bacterium]
MNGANPPAISFHEVSRSFGGRAVLNNVSFEVAPGEAFCLLGRSGMGKSVTLKLTIGLIQPDAGAICVEDHNIVGMDEDGLSKVRSRIGFLFQSGALFDSLSLHDNLALPLKRLREKKPEEEIESIVQKNLDDVGLGQDGRKMPSELSGGMRKRAGLARALMLSPSILLVDEPVSGLDRVTAAEIDDLLLRVRKRDSTTMVIVTHDTREARRIADRVGVLNNGNLIAVGGMDELTKNQNALVRALVSGAE